jgi:negative regulator of flagellin synthesis FlgM
MKITHNKVGQNVNVRDTNRGEKADATAAAKTGIAESTSAGLKELAELGASKVDISQRAQDVRKAKEIANAQPDVDEAKVARLQKMIDEGKYKVDASAIADKMISEQSSWE